MYSQVETEIFIRPDDIDQNNHVHATKYIDYVFAARHTQMREFYKMSMNEFAQRGYNWFASIIHIDYKRSLKLEDEIIVKTQINYISGAQVKILFWIIKKVTGKIAAEGYIYYTMVDVKSGRPIRIPPDIIEKYTI